MNLNRPVPKDIQELIDLGAVFYCSHSGGKDSQVMYAYLSRHIPHDQLVVLHADLGKVEWEGTQDHIKATISHELHVVSAGKTLFDMARHRRMFPAPKYRQCTSDLKTGPSYKFIRNDLKARGKTIAVNCLGFRKEESPNRFKKCLTPLSLNETLSTKILSKGKLAGTRRRTAFNWYPIGDLTTQEVFHGIKQAGQEPHRAYGLGMSRLSCCFCIMASKSDLRISAKANPELFQEYLDLEKEIGHTMFMSKKQPIALDEYIQEGA